MRGRTVSFALAACTLLAIPAGCTKPAAPPGASAADATAASPLFDETIKNLRARIEASMEAGVPVPQPIDAGGGYAHEQHKKNGKTIYEAGMLYRLTGDARYRDFATAILEDYAALYPTLGLHPERKGQAPGKLFWQGLNETVWLVYAIQGYEAIRPDLDEAARANIEAGVIRPMAEFLSDGSRQTFDRIHNHGTWAAAAVGMTGYVLGDRDMIDKALLGLDKSGNAGFLKQLDMLFSPDGYYAEGPYYQRYALMPFVLFAQAIERHEPDRKIFERRDGVLMKAIFATIQQTYAGRFFPINDAIREKGLNTAELRYALAIAYDRTGDPTLLDIAWMLDQVVPTPEGRALSDALAAGKAKPFPFKSMLLRDGADGQAGALAILRSGPEPDAAALVFKATSQGMGHGHFDRLGLLYFDNGDEVVADYGAARFLNVEPKDGGRYLPENESWAAQTIAHNTLVVDQASHFGGNWERSEKSATKILAFGEAGGSQFAAAEIDTAYEGVTIRRAVALVPRDNDASFIIDVVRAHSATSHIYDLPVHFKGQLIETGFEMDHAVDMMVPLGEASGYQHLWKRAQSEAIPGLSHLSWLVADQFYTLTFKASAPLTAYLTELGANDPNNNLRSEQAIILRAHARETDLVSVYEPNGLYDNDEEVTVFDGGSVTSIASEARDGVTIYSIGTKADGSIHLLFADDTDAALTHSLQLDGKPVMWTGAVHIVR